MNDASAGAESDSASSANVPGTTDNNYDNDKTSDSETACAMGAENGIVDEQDESNAHASDDVAPVCTSAGKAEGTWVTTFS